MIMCLCVSLKWTLAVCFFWVNEKMGSVTSFDLNLRLLIYRVRSGFVLTLVWCLRYVCHCCDDCLAEAKRNGNYFAFRYSMNLGIWDTTLARISPESQAIGSLCFDTGFGNGNVINIVLYRCIHTPTCFSV